MIITWVLGAFAGLLVVVAMLRAWSSRRLAAPDRHQLVAAIVDAVVGLALVRAVAPPPGALVWLWVAAAGAVGLAVAGAVLRWPTLGWLAHGRHAHSAEESVPRSPRRALRTLGYAAGGAVLVAVLA